MVVRFSSATNMHLAHEHWLFSDIINFISKIFYTSLFRSDFFVLIT
jgi:hypothetical protein